MEDRYDSNSQEDNSIDSPLLLNLSTDNRIVIPTHNNNGYHDDPYLESNLDMMFQDALDKIHYCNMTLIIPITIFVKVIMITYLIRYYGKIDKEQCVQMLIKTTNMSLFKITILICLLSSSTTVLSILFVKNVRYNAHRVTYYIFLCLTILLYLFTIIIAPILYKLYPACGNTFLPFIIISCVDLINVILYFIAFIIVVRRILSNRASIYTLLNIPILYVKINENIIQELNESEKVCSICLEGYDDKNNQLVELKCGHVFHDYCIGRWFHAIQSRESITCPYCNQSVKNLEV